jgi:hypothetical protein
MKSMKSMVRLITLLSAFGFVAAAPAAASRHLPIGGALLASLQVVGGQNVCFKYTYDKNGNRVSKVNLTWGPGATWGSTTYGCFNWTPSV